MLFNLAWW